MKLELISRYPAGDSRATPLLFVHGAWHAAWCWDVHFLPYFTQHGYAAHALSLRGHGGSEGRRRLRWHRIPDYVADVAQTVQQLPQPPVLIGHSMGGLIVQKYLERTDAPAAVLLASVPPSGVLATTWRVARHHPLAFAKANLTLSLYPIVATPALAREALFTPDMPEEAVQDYAGRLQDESYRAFLDMLAFSLPKPHKVKTPMLVLGAGRDTIIVPAQVEATARAYGTRAEIFPEMGHDMMLDPAWEQAAQRILTWLRERGL
ncbi:MAG: lysophospholipase [Caldilineales bacterium]|nr:lysophospholipase [Caldilineales bacterium]MDW8316573.1 alpha/beta fold hydrolase [Anaerolineae bacterium]